MAKIQVKSESFSQIDWDKTNRDLEFIKSLQSLCQSQNWRIVVSGGYGLDILLGRITRTHNDVDILIYGQSNRLDAKVKIQDYLQSIVSNPTIKVSENDFLVDIDLNSPGLGAGLYYIQTVNNPFVALNAIIKRSGEQITNSPKRFPPPVRGILNDLEIDVQNPHIHLADILFKQRTQPHKPMHTQDIVNLRGITDPQLMGEILSLS